MEDQKAWRKRQRLHYYRHAYQYNYTKTDTGYLIMTRSKYAATMTNPYSSRYRVNESVQTSPGDLAPETPRKSPVVEMPVEQVSNSAVIGVELSLPVHYTIRSDVEEAARSKIQAMLTSNDSGFLVFHGDSGVGKTSLLTSILTRAFLETNGIAKVAWANAYQPTDPGGFQESLFFSRLEELFKPERKTTKEKSKALMLKHLSKMTESHGKLVIVCDNVIHDKALTCAKSMGERNRKIRVICVTSQKLTFDPKISFKIEPMPNDILKKIAGQILEQPLKEWGGNDLEKVPSKLAQLSKGLPLLTRLFSGSVGQLKSARDCDDLLAKLEKSSGESSAQQVQQDFSRRSPDMRKPFYAFLAFEPLQPVDLEDLAIIWRYEDLEQARMFARKLCDLGMAVAYQSSDDSSQDLKFGIHELLYSAAIRYLAREEADKKLLADTIAKEKKLIDFEKPSSVKQAVLYFRKNLFRMTGNERTGENCLHLAVKNHRKTLTELIYESLKLSKSRFLTEMCAKQASQDAGAETPLHLLVKKAEDWLELERSFALDKACDLSQKLLVAADKAAEDSKSKEKDHKRRESKDRKESSSKRDSSKESSSRRSSSKDHKESKESSSSKEKDIVSSLKDSLGITVMQLLLENVKKTNGKKACLNALMVAVERGYLELMKALLKGDKLNAATVDDQGNNVLMMAAQMGRAELVKYVVKRTEIDVNAKNHKGETALLLACKFGEDKAMKALMEESKAKNKDLDLNVLDSDGYNGLLLAIKLGKLETMKMLVDGGADVKAKSKRGESAIWLAILSEDLAIVAAVAQKEGGKPNLTKEEVAALHRHCLLRDLTELKKFLAAIYKRESGRSNSPSPGDDLNMDKMEDAFSKLMGFDIREIDRSAQSKLFKTLFSQGGKDAEKLLPSDTNALNFSMFLTCYFGNADVAKFLINRDVQLTAVNVDGWTPLMMAAANSHHDVVANLLENGATKCPELVDFASPVDGKTALMLAAKYGHKEVVQQLLLGQANTDDIDRDGMTALMYASSRGHLEVVKLLVDDNADCNFVDKNGTNALMFACVGGFKEVVKLILKSPADIDVNAMDSSGLTALMMAAQNGHLDIIKLLGSEGNVNINSLNGEGSSVLLAACQNPNNGALVKWLIRDAKANVNLANKNGQTPLMIASNFGFADQVEELLKANAEVDAKSNVGWTPLMFACQNGHHEVVSILINAKAKIDITEKDGGNTALMLACQNGHEKAVKALLYEGHADPNIKNKDGNTALHLAAYFGQSLEVVKLLVTPNKASGYSKVADIKIKDNDGDTAANLAKMQKHAEIAAFLDPKSDKSRHGSTSSSSSSSKSSSHHSSSSSSNRHSSSSSSRHSSSSSSKHHSSGHKKK